MENGIFENLTIRQYLDEPGTRSGALSRAADALALYKYDQENPSDEEGTTWAPFGSALHYRVLEPTKFKFLVGVCPKVDRRTKIGKETYDSFCAENIGKLIITQDEADKIEAMYQAIQASDTAKKVLANCKTEISVFWNDRDSGERCKARLDGWNEKNGVIVELKGVRSARYHQFSSQVVECGWHRQAAHQALGMKANGKTVGHHVFLAVEKEPPHLLTVTELDPAQVELAERSNQAVLKKIATAKMLNHFPGYDDFIQLMTLPEWAVKNLEASL